MPPSIDILKNYRLLGLVLLVCLLTGGLPAGAQWWQGNIYRTAYAILAHEDNWKWSPAVAYDSKHNEYLAVWETILVGNHHAIYGRRVSAACRVLGDEFVVYSGTNNSLQPSVAYDSTHDRYLVVWAYDYAGDGLDNDIYGRFIPWNGPSPSQGVFGINTSLDNTTKPKVAYGVVSDRFLMVWEIQGSTSIIAGALLLNDMSFKSVAISSGPEPRDFPDVTYKAAGDEFAATWEKDVGRDAMDLDVYARRLDSAGAPIGSEFTVANSTRNEQHPTVAACGDHYLFAWQNQATLGYTRDDIWGRPMSGAGALGSAAPIVGSTLSQGYPRLSCNVAGNQYFLVWHDQYAQPALRWGVWGMLIQPDFTLGPAFEVVRPSDTRDRRYPAVAYGNSTALVAWQHARDDTNYLDIWAQGVWPNAHAVFLPMVVRQYQ
jgi:hypothetical protein